MSDDSSKINIQSRNISSSAGGKELSAASMASLTVKFLGEAMLPWWTNLVPWTRQKLQKSLAEKKIELVEKLYESRINPHTFDVLLTNDTNRDLKKKFGVAFIMFTFIFTAASYAIVILNSILKWGIPDVAIIALIIETPLQFIGLLYIIARNLFPHKDELSKDFAKRLEKEIISARPEMPEKKEEDVKDIL